MPGYARVLSFVNAFDKADYSTVLRDLQGGRRLWYTGRKQKEAAV